MQVAVHKANLTISGPFTYSIRNQICFLMMVDLKQKFGPLKKLSGLNKELKLRIMLILRNGRKYHKHRLVLNVPSDSDGVSQLRISLSLLSEAVYWTTGLQLVVF